MPSGTTICDSRCKLTFSPVCPMGPDSCTSGSEWTRGCGEGFRWCPSDATIVAVHSVIPCGQADAGAGACCRCCGVDCGYTGCDTPTSANYERGDRRRYPVRIRRIGGQCTNVSAPEIKFSNSPGPCLWTDWEYQLGVGALLLLGLHCWQKQNQKLVMHSSNLEYLVDFLIH